MICPGITPDLRVIGLVDLVRSGEVSEERLDVPFDTADPLFRFGHGLSC